ncbi:hypothetical protein VW927_11970 [Enterococcus faecalis]|nr:hypothetical protein [Enterococcus faecalis]
MAKAIMKMPEDFLMKVSKLESKTDEILPRVLESGAEVVEAKVEPTFQQLLVQIPSLKVSQLENSNERLVHHKPVKIRTGTGISKLVLTNHGLTVIPMPRLRISLNTVVTVKHLNLS